MNAISACAASQRDNQIAGLDLVGMATMGENAQTAAEDQRIGQVAGVDRQGADAEVPGDKLHARPQPL